MWRSKVVLYEVEEEGGGRGVGVEGGVCETWKVLSLTGNERLKAPGAAGESSAKQLLHDSCATQGP